MLHLYSDSVELSDDGTYQHPLLVSLDSAKALTKVVKLYLRNDDAAKYYTGISVYPVDGGSGIVDGADGYSWKLVRKDDEPLEIEWDASPAGGHISFSDIGASGAGDTVTYIPFWLMVTVPKYAQVKTYSDVRMAIDYTEHTV